MDVFGAKPAEFIATQQAFTGLTAASTQFVAIEMRFGVVQPAAQLDGFVAISERQSLDAAKAMAERVAGLSPKSVEFCKSLIHNARNGIPRRAGLALERERFMDLFDFEDQHEGVSAFLEKRKPEWKNG